MAIGEAITIPQSLIDKLKPFGPHFIKVAKPIAGDSKSGKNAVEHAWQEHPYEADSEQLQEWLRQGNNYGVVAGQGIAQIDFDEKTQFEKFEAKVSTFTVKSGRVSGEGRHYYFRTDTAENGLIFGENGVQIGNVQVHNKFVVGPGCRHNSGGVYGIVKDVPLAWVSKHDLETIFGDSLKWTGQIRQKDDEEVEEEKTHGIDIPLVLLFDLSEFKQRGNEYQGSHPLHGSTTGTNFCVNVKQNVWHCFRCNSGGGGLMWIAVKHGLLQCHEAQKGALRGLKFIEAVKFAREEGFEIKLPEEEINPDVERFFEKDEDGKKRFVAANVARELMKETSFLTQTTKGLIYCYNPSKGIYESSGEDYVNAQTVKKLGKHYSTNRRNEIEAFIRASTIKEIPESDKYLLAVKNGVLDVRTGELQPFSPEFFIFNALNVEYDPTAQCPLFTKFLAEVVPSETDRKVLQEHGGYALLKENRFQKALMLTGNKQNGKSTFLHVLESMLGKGNVSAIPLQLLSNSNFRFYISQLYGKMANICADLPAQPLAETDVFKKIVAGDTVTGEFKYHPAFDFVPYAKLFYSANQLPSLPKDTEAFLVRWDMVEFPKQFLPGDPRRDPELKAKLTTPEELSGVLNWCLEGLQRLLRQNAFTRGETLEELEDRWIVEGDSVKAFVERCAVTDDFEAKTDVTKTYEAYVQFCNRHKVTPYTQKRFSREFKENTKANTTVVTVDEKRVRVWTFVSIKEEEDERTTKESD